MCYVTPEYIYDCNISCLVRHGGGRPLVFSFTLIEEPLPGSFQDLPSLNFMLYSHWLRIRKKKYIYHSWGLYDNKLGPVGN